MMLPALPVKTEQAAKLAAEVARTARMDGVPATAKGLSVERETLIAWLARYNGLYANRDQRGNPVRPTLSLNAQETRDLTQLIETLYRLGGNCGTVHFGALLGDDDAWTVGQEVAKWYQRLA